MKNEVSVEVLDVAIVGGGPAGLSCAIESGKRGLTSVVLDKGAIVDAIRRFPHAMTFFSTPELLELGGVPFPSSGFRPTRVETLRYYQSVVRFFKLPVKTGEEVRAIRKTGTTLRSFATIPSRLHIRGVKWRWSGGKILPLKSPSIYFAMERMYRWSTGGCIERRCEILGSAGYREPDKERGY